MRRLRRACVHGRARAVLVRCSAVRCGAVVAVWVQCGAVRCGAVRCGAVRCGAVWCGRAGGRVSSYAWWCGVRRSGVRCGAVRCGVVWWVCGRRRVPFCFPFLWFLLMSRAAASSSRVKRAARPPTHPPCVVYVRASAASCVCARACSCGARAVQCSAVRCGAVWCGRASGRVLSYASWCGVRQSSVRCGAVRCGAVRCGAVRCGVVWCGGCAVGGVYRFLFPCGSLSPVASSKRAARCARGAQGRVGRRPCDAIPPGLNRGAGLVPGMQVAGGRGAAASSTGRPGEAGVKEAKRARKSLSSANHRA